MSKRMGEEKKCNDTSPLFNIYVVEFIEVRKYCPVLQICTSIDHTITFERAVYQHAPLIISNSISQKSIGNAVRYQTLNLHLLESHA